MPRSTLPFMQLTRPLLQGYTVHKLERGVETRVLQPARLSSQYLPGTFQSQSALVVHPRIPMLAHAAAPSNTRISNLQSMDHAADDADVDSAFAAAQESEFPGSSSRDIFIANIHA